MAEFEEAAGLIGEVEDGIKDEDETTEEEEKLPKEEKEQLEKEAKEANKNVKELAGITKKLQDINVPQLLKQFTGFIAEQAAIAAVSYGVNVVLENIAASVGGSGGESSESAKRKLTKMKSLSILIQDLSNTSHDLLQWLIDEQKVTVDLGSGFIVHLPDIFTKYISGIQTNLHKSYEVAKQLIDRSVNPPTFTIPTTDQVTTIVTSSDGFVNALKGFVDFAAQKASQFPDLKTLPVTQATITKLTTDLDTVKQLPY